MQMKLHSFICLSPPAMQPFPNRPLTSTGPRPRGWELGTPALEVMVFLVHLKNNRLAKAKAFFNSH